MKRTLKRSISIILALLTVVSTMACLTTMTSAISYSGSASYMSGKYYRQLTQVSLTGNGATDIVNVAISQIGYKSGASNNDLSGETSSEKNDKYSEYGRVIGFNPNDWCAYFVSWCARQAGIPESVIPNFAKCTQAYNSTLPNAGCIMHRRTSGYVPKAGDIIFFGNSSDNIYHVGIVRSATSSTVYYIDGNNTNTIPHSVYNSSRSLTNSSIWGYATPNYSGGGNECSCSTSYAGNYTCTTSNYPLTIRNGHGTSYASLGTIPKGATVYVSKANGSWAHVTYNGINGYASMEYLKKAHTHSYVTEYEAAHPHREYKKCYGCNDWSYTNTNRTLNTCSSCWYAKITLSPTSLSLKVGETKTVSYSVSGCLPEGRALVYYRNSNFVESTAKNGIITLKGIAPGSFNLTVYVYSDSSRTHLINSVSIPVTVTATHYTGKVSFDKSSMDLVIPSKKSDTLTINLSGYWQDGAGYLFEYNENIVSLSQNKTVLTITAKEEGSTDFTIKIVDQNNNNALITSATCRINVTNAKYKLTFDANDGTGKQSFKEVPYGQKVSLDYNLTRSGYEFLGWSTNKNATTAEYPFGSRIKIKENTTLYAVWKAVTLTEVKCIPPDKNNYYIGDSLDTYGLALILRYSDGSERTINGGYTISGFSSSTSGKKMVTVSYGGKTDTFYVYVETPEILVSKTSLTMKTGETSTLTASTMPSGRTVTWSSSNTNVATVSKGTITAKASGTATITAKFTYNGITYSKTCLVTVSHTHTMSNWITDKNATCTVNGSKYKKCTTCGVVLETAVIPATGHSESSWIIGRHPTCLVNGTKYKVCTVCDMTIETSAIIATGHTEVKDNAIAPTCTKTGKTEGSHCSVCNAVIKAQTTVSAKGHTESGWIIDEEATLYTAGLKHTECTVCGLTIKTEEIAQLKCATPKVTASNALNGVDVKWNSVSGAVKYDVYRRQAGSNIWVLIGTTTGTSLTDANVVSGIYYCYCVKAYNSAGQSSDFMSANTKAIKYMATPKLTGISNATNGLYIKWNAVTGITNGYRVYRRGAGSTYWTYLGTVKTTYYTDTQVKNRSGEYFRYTVIADGGYHSKFDTTGLYLRRLANPTLNSATSSYSGVTVKWGSVKGATSYYVYRKTANTGWTLIAIANGNTNTAFLDKTACKGTTYTYTVRAAYGSILSYFNSGISCYDRY